jgi:Ca2+-binding RTX toxin-like protein
MGRSKRLAIDDGSWAYRFEYFNDPVAPTVIGGFRDVADYVELDTAGGFDDPLYVDADRISPPHVVVWAKGLVSFDLVTERQAIFMAVANANTLFSRFPGTGSSIGYIDPAGYDTIGVGVRQDERSIGKFRYFEASLQIEFKDTVTFNFSETAIFIEGVFQQPANIPARPAQALTTNGTDEDNVINGSATAQTINGLGGNDTITVGAAGCDVDGGSGNDTILGAQANCNLFGGDDDDTITAGEANYVEGGSGNDTITASGLFTTKGYFDGGAGFDRAVLDFSAFGNDITLTLRSDGGNTHLIKSEAATFAYVDIEAVTINGGSGADTLTGSDTADTLNGNGGQDTLDGGTGADTLNGGADNDTFYVDNTADNVIEDVFGGSGDVVFASVSYALPGRFVETLTLTGSEAINATGNSQINTLNGNNAANVLDGLGGADKMTGGLGNDT